MGWASFPPTDEEPGAQCHNLPSIVTSNQRDRACIKASALRLDILWGFFPTWQFLKGKNLLTWSSLKCGMNLSKLRGKKKRLHLTLIWETFFFAWPSNYDSEPREGNITLTHCWPGSIQYLYSHNTINSMCQFSNFRANLWTKREQFCYSCKIGYKYEQPWQSRDKSCLVFFKCV